MGLSAFCQSLLDECRSETKRLGGELSIVHLAAVLQRKFPALAGNIMPSEDVKVLLRRSAVGGEAQVLEVLEAAGTGPDQAGELVETVRNRLADLSAGADGASADGDTANVQESVDPAAVQQEQSRPDWLSGVGDFLEPVEIIGREGVVDAIIERIGREHRPISPLLVGRAGSGRTAVLSALATRLRSPDYNGPLAGYDVFRVKAHALAERGGASALRNLANELGPDTVMCIDDLEVAAAFTRHGADMELLRTVRALVAEQSPRVVLCVDAHQASQLAAFANELDDELDQVPLGPLDDASMSKVVDTAADSLQGSHGVTIPQEVRELAMAQPRGGGAPAHPGLAIGRIDRSCVRARLAGRDDVVAADLGTGAAPSDGPVVADELARRLLARVKGQDEAVIQITERLALTRAQLDLRPDRPDGVFLIVGPTGVGKTELAKALADELFGSHEALIRLDMTEYAHEWALSMITGPPPGYVGSTDPAGWLTTKVLNRPDAVILLDEFEKSHSRIWNTFLQVFDDGRLTDSMGRTVDFSRTVFVLTSNLGAREAAKTAPGFASASGAGARFDDRMKQAAKETIAPELLNRLDDIVVFRALTIGAIEEIARHSVSTVVDRYRARGFDLEVDDGVVAHLAATGYSPEYGARHLHRNIEQHLLGPLVGVRGTRLRASMDGGTITWSEPPGDAG